MFKGLNSLIWNSKESPYMFNMLTNTDIFLGICQLTSLDSFDVKFL